jgi:ComF family protein
MHLMTNLFSTLCTTLLQWIFPPRRTEAILSLVYTEDILSLPRAEYIDEDTYALFSYKDPKVSALIWEIKYHKNTRAVETIAPLLADMILEEYSERSLFENWQTCLLMPVPSSLKRVKKRGYSHTELIAEAVARRLPKEIKYSPKILKKIVETSEQNKLPNRAQRLKNLDNTQEVVGTLLPHTSVILLDDVTTTGTTLSESRRALTRAGVKNIIAFTIAH